MNYNTNKYKKPDDIPSNMGGTDDELDERMKNVLELLEQGPLDKLETFLDIGMGKGQLATFLAKKGKKVTGTGLELDSYEAELSKLKQAHGIESIECHIESMPFKDKSFDGIVMSHVLEHCPNIGLALNEVQRVLKDNGWLFLFVPPHETRVCAGHISVGWNIGQLMYVLLINGLNIKTGKFVQYGYNVAAFVQKNSTPLPPLRYDQGDINILASKGFFPAPIKTEDGYNDGYFGNLIAVNWNQEFVNKMIEKNSGNRAHRPILEKTIDSVMKIFPRKIRTKLSQKTLTLANIIYGNGDKDNKGAINPEILSG